MELTFRLLYCMFINHVLYPSLDRCYLEPEVPGVSITYLEPNKIATVEEFDENNYRSVQIHSGFGQSSAGSTGTRHSCLRSLFNPYSYAVDSESGQCLIELKALNAKQMLEIKEPVKRPFKLNFNLVLWNSSMNILTKFNPGIHPDISLCVFLLYPVSVLNPREYSVSVYTTTCVTDCDQLLIQKPKNQLRYTFITLTYLFLCVLNFNVLFRFMIWFPLYSVVLPC